jgi:hypothetical protein
MTAGFGHAAALEDDASAAPDARRRRAGARSPIEPRIRFEDVGWAHRA